MSTESVINHHLEAFSSGNIDALMEDYTEDSALILAEATLTGLESIRAPFTDFLTGLFKPGTYEFTMDRMEILGDIAYLVWHSTNQGAEVKLATDTFLIQDDKIKVQTLTALIV